MSKSLFAKGADPRLVLRPKVRPSLRRQVLNKRQGWARRRLRRTAVVGDASGVEEFPGSQAVVLHLHLLGLFVVGMAEHLL